MAQFGISVLGTSFGIGGIVWSIYRLLRMIERFGRFVSGLLGFGNSYDLRIVT